MFERVLLAVDGSPASLRAKDVAASMSAATGCQILVFHVREVDVARSAEHGQEEPDHALRLVSDIVSELRVRGLDARGEALSADSGRVAPAILDAATEFKADVIVMGTRGLSEFAALLVGSVAHKVIHHAECAVLVTR